LKPGMPPQSSGGPSLSPPTPDQGIGVPQLDANSAISLKLSDAAFWLAGLIMPASLAGWVFRFQGRADQDRGCCD